VRFATRLVWGTVLVLVAAMAILVVTASRSLRQELEAEIRTSLEREARLVRDALPEDPNAWQGFVTRMAQATDHRITLIDSTGRVLAESNLGPAVLPLIPTQADRPEVLGVLGGEPSSAHRESDNPRQVTLYVAIPGGPGIVRVASDLAAVDAVVGAARRSVSGAALLALLIGGVLALIAGNSIARPLRELTASAQAIAAGTAPRFPRSGIPDVDRVIEAIREMHQQLGHRIDLHRHEQAESSALVDAMLEGVLASDGRGRIIRANPAARRLLGYDPGEPLPELETLFRAKAAREVVDAVRGGASIQDREIELDDRVVLISARPLPNGGVVIVLHDLTHVRRLEAVRRDFVANVSHELKTPLTSISGYAETLLTDQPDEATTRRFLETILSNARRMQRLVDDQLDLSRIESGHWQPRWAEVDVAAVVREAWATCADRAGARGVTLESRVDPAARRIRADADALRQVLVNLLDNAVRYSPDGSAIHCSAMPSGPGIELAVADTGPGIASEHLPRIFERFYRADSSRSRDEGGTGLGLAIVKHLAEAHGGRVRAESSLGHGTRLVVWLPGESPA
jgi:signal transduction histidine kinase